MATPREKWRFSLSGNAPEAARRRGSRRDEEIDRREWWLREIELLCKLRGARRSPIEIRRIRVSTTNERLNVSRSISLLRECHCYDDFIPTGIYLLPTPRKTFSFPRTTQWVISLTFPISFRAAYVPCKIYSRRSTVVFLRRKHDKNLSSSFNILSYTFTLPSYQSNNRVWNAFTWVKRWYSNRA